ncbi:MAG: hypothetical protein PHY93_11670 [Bacteriovorax sp.]|nr:hypothetical protein [Bacteriovorax sp.]
MKRIELHSVALLFCLLHSNHALAIEEKIYNLNGNEPIEMILEKIGAPTSKSLVFPLVYKNNNREIKVEVQKTPEKIISIDFTPPNEFTVNEKDLFEKVETSKKRDIINQNLIVSDPKSGRIFHLTSELKVSKLDLVEPWNSKQALKSLKEILEDMYQPKIQLRPKKKAEVKK